MKESVKKRTIEWLETTRSHGSFDGFDEEHKDFNECDDEEIEWYFIEWFFTDGLIEDLDENEIEESYKDEMQERIRILNRQD